MSEYCVDSSAFLERARTLYNDIDGRPESLYYCAYELRMCIERLSYEYLYLARNGKIRNSDRKLYSCSNITKTIREKVISDFEKRMEFLNIILEGLGAKSEEFVPIPDFKMMRKMYSNLSGYMHAPRVDPMEPEETTVSNVPLNGYVKECVDYLMTILTKNRRFLHFNPRTMKLYQEYKEGKKTREEIVALIRSENG